MTAVTGWPPPDARVLTMGRYLPPTKADEALLTFASSLATSAGATRLTVAVLTAPYDPIAFDIRRQWLRHLAPAADVVAVPMDAMTAESPLGPAASPAARGRGFQDVVRSRCGHADALVGPGLRDREMARALGLQYVPVEVPWETPSASALLTRPLAHWDALPAVLRSDFARRVVIMGPESTGKTTLARDLARHFRTTWVGEYLRVWLDAKGAVCEPHDLPRVVAGHRASEDALARHADRVLFCDTDPLMTAVYSRFYYGELPPWLDEAAGARRASLYLLLDCDVPWVADPQRDMPHRRDEIRDLCREELERRGLPWTLVRGSWAERLAFARDVVDGVLSQ